VKGDFVKSGKLVPTMIELTQKCRFKRPDQAEGKDCFQGEKRTGSHIGRTHYSVRISRCQVFFWFFKKKRNPLDRNLH